MPGVARCPGGSRERLAKTRPGGLTWRVLGTRGPAPCIAPEHPGGAWGLCSELPRSKVWTQRAGSGPSSLTPPGTSSSKPESLSVRQRVCPAPCISMCRAKPGSSAPGVVGGRWAGVWAGGTRPGHLCSPGRPRLTAAGNGDKVLGQAYF